MTLFWITKSLKTRTTLEYLYLIGHKKLLFSAFLPFSSIRMVIILANGKINKISAHYADNTIHYNMRHSWYSRMVGHWNGKNRMGAKKFHPSRQCRDSIPRRSTIENDWKVSKLNWLSIGLWLYLIHRFSVSPSHNLVHSTQFKKSAEKISCDAPEAKKSISSHVSPMPSPSTPTNSQSSITSIHRTRVGITADSIQQIPPFRPRKSKEWVPPEVVVSLG